MKKLLLPILFVMTTSFIMAQTKVILTTGGQSVTATLADNSATRELVALLKQAPITIEMSDYGGFEKVGALPQSFTTSNSQITTEPGDIMLYQGRNMVIFYGSNSWSYTPLGKIDGATAQSVKSFLGSGNISLTVSLDVATGIGNIADDEANAEIVYDLYGRRITHRPLQPGIYIINGKKRMIR